MAFDQRRPQVSLDGIVVRIGSVEADVVVGVEAPRLVVENVRRRLYYAETKYDRSNKGKTVRLCGSL